jgi:DNA-binding MarR family transcriptional regulator
MVDEDNVMLCLCHNLRRATRRTTQIYDAALRPSGLKITQFILLAAIDKMGKATMAPLAEFLAMDRTTLTRNLDLLQKRNLVAVAEDRADRRHQVVSLLPGGKEALRKALPRWAKARDATRELLSPGAATRLLRVLERLTSA